MRGLLLLMVAIAGCASGPPPRVPAPNGAVVAYFAAVRADDPAAAYRLLAPEARARIGRERFDALWAENRGELQALAADAARTETRATTRAHAELAGGEQVVLVLEDGQWKLDGGVLDAQSLGSPMDAVLAMRRALERQSLPSLLRVLSRQRQAAWLATFEEAVERSADPLDLRVEISGDEAVVHTSGGGEIHLKREAGTWRVWDVR